MKKFLAAILTGTLLLFGTQATFAATENTLSQSQITSQQLDEQGLKANLTSLGIDKPTQEKLINKLKHGEVWDSMNPEKIKQVENELIITPKQHQKKHVFNDGSVIQTSLTGGTSSCGTGYCSYRGVTVTRNSGLVSANFQANYTIAYGTSVPDDITSAYNWNIFTYFGTYSNQSLAVVIPDEYIGSNRYAAQAELDFVYTTKDGYGSGTYKLALYVGKDSAWQGANW